MLRFVSVVVLATLLLMKLSQEPTYATKYQPDIVSHGSLPPVPQLYSCTGAVANDGYDQQQAKSCLDSVLASGYFSEGHIDLKPLGNGNLVEFVLTAPPVFVQTLSFDMPQPVKEKMFAWLSRGEKLLGEGDEYQSHADERIAELIHYFFWDIGKQVGVSRTIKMDYRRHVATITYHVSIGPDRIRSRFLPPYEPECDHSIQSFNTTDVDDFVPMNLVQQITQTHAFDCFDAKSIAADAAILRKSNLFDNVEYAVSGDKDKDVSISIKGKPLTVKRVQIVGYGLLSGRALASDPNTLTLREGDIYSRARAFQSVDLLEQKYNMEDYNAEVYEEDQLANSDQLIVTFQVFAFEKDRVTVNGKEFVVPPVALGFVDSPSADHP